MNPKRLLPILLSILPAMFLHGADKALPKSIEISSSTTWTLEIFPNGAGTLTYGDAHFTKFLPGTLPFPDIWKKLTAEAKPEAPGEVPANHIHFGILYGQDWQAFHLDYKNAPYLLQLFSIAEAKCTFRKEEMDRIMATEPFLPKK